MTHSLCAIVDFVVEEWWFWNLTILKQWPRTKQKCIAGSIDLCYTSLDTGTIQKTLHKA